MIDLSVVIGTFNQAPALRHVLQSFGDQTHPADRFEVIVVDSESTDETRAVCQAPEFPFPLVYVRRNNEGKCAARNAGLRVARAEHVLLTDGDVLADRALVAAHVAAISQFAGAVVVGQQYMVPEPRRECASARPCLSPHWSRGRALSWREFVTGNASLPRAALLQAGGFDEGFRGYGFEDYELGYRLVQRGMRFVFDPTAVNYHWHPVTFASDLVRKREAGRAAVYFAARHPSRALRIQLGVTPLNRALYRGIGAAGWLERACDSLKNGDGPAGRCARHLLLELEYQRGAGEAWRARNSA
jgi:glycosyltransferase involved in cell wall biosynthesis